jgi:2-amino-4-hydroxy-6-hydroxymethyldihydropteridine diphosphokinase
VTRAAVALGSNLEDPEAQVNRGFDELAALADTALVARSRLFRTAPVGYVDQPDFVNGSSCSIRSSTRGRMPRSRGAAPCAT